jgi:50S ribosomal protein L16 3-hydroxylase
MLRPIMQPPVLTRLGPLSIDAFMRGYWGRKPVLLRQAVPALVASPVVPADLFALAAREDVESRLVTACAARWCLAHGPFARRHLPALKRDNWTLLVQGVDQHLRPAHELLRRFRFIADARLDDLMASFATRGGGVGPHVDSYDVFLLQAQGRRRWRISRQRDLELIPDLPVKILRDFRATAEWVLEPGDMLYLPPGVAHEGVALDRCITLSIGFRAPAWQELVQPWFDLQAEKSKLAGRFTDTGARRAAHPAELPAALLRATRAQLAKLRPRGADARELLLRHLTEPKANVVFEPSPRPLAAARFAQAARAGRLRLEPDLRTRMLSAGTLFAINGEIVRGSRTLSGLADRRALEPPALMHASSALLRQLHEWYVCGWLRLASRRAGAAPT